MVILFFTKQLKSVIKKNVGLTFSLRKVIYRYTKHQLKHSCTSKQTLFFFFHHVKLSSYQVHNMVTDLCFVVVASPVRMQTFETIFGILIYQQDTALYLKTYIQIKWILL